MNESLKTSQFILFYIEFMQVDLCRSLLYLSKKGFAKVYLIHVGC